MDRVRSAFLSVIPRPLTASNVDTVTYTDALHPHIHQEHHTCDGPTDAACPPV